VLSSEAIDERTIVRLIVLLDDCNITLPNSFLRHRIVWNESCHPCLASQGKELAIYTDQPARAQEAAKGLSAVPAPRIGNVSHFRLGRSWSGGAVVASWRLIARDLPGWRRM